MRINSQLLSAAESCYNIRVHTLPGRLRVPIGDRDYMREPPPPTRRPVRYAGFGNFSLNYIWVLIIINFILFLVTTFSRDAFIRLGLIPLAFLEQPWSLITNMFVHSGFGHIFGNMLTLFFFGRALIMLVGQNRFLLVYFVGGIVGNILYLVIALFTPFGEPLSIAVGASGAVYAVAGALVMMVPKLRVHLYFVLPMPLWVVILVFFVIWSIPGFMPNIAWEAHLGGLIFGLIAGYFFRRKFRYIMIR